MELATASEGIHSSEVSGASAGSATVTNSEAVGTQPASPEKTFTQSQLNDIVGKTREDARKTGYSRGRQEAEVELKRAQEVAVQQQPAQQAHQENSFGGVPQMSQNDIDARIEAKIQQRAEQEHAKRLINEFTTKLESAKNLHPDFEDVISSLNLPNHPHLVSWANGLENCAESLYDLGNNPSKYANILMLSHTAPQLALREMQKLSESITANRKAKEAEKAVNKPLSTVSHSTVGTDSGSLTVSDFRRQKWLRA